MRAAQTPALLIVYIGTPAEELKLNY